MNKKTRLVFISRLDGTIPPTEEEVKKNKRTPKVFAVKINNEIPSSHKMLRECLKLY